MFFHKKAFSGVIVETSCVFLENMEDWVYRVHKLWKTEGECRVLGWEMIL